MSFSFPALHLPLPRRKGTSPHPVVGADPYRAMGEASVTEAIAALDPDEGAWNPGRPVTEDTVVDVLAVLPARPSFTPSGPFVQAPSDPAETGALPVLAEAQATVMREIRTSQGTQPQATQPMHVTDPGIMSRVLEGLRRLDMPRRTETFRRDFGQLPLFRQAARTAGWAGLHAEQAAPGYQRMTADRWYAAQMARIGHATEMAQAGIRAQATLYDGVEAHRRAAADAAHRFGNAA